MNPEPADQAGYRKRKGSRGGRPVRYDVQDYKQRNVVERFFNRIKNWGGLATATTSTRSSTKWRRSRRDSGLAAMTSETP